MLYPIKNAEEVNTGKLDVTALGVAAPDERNVEITLRAPTPYFLRLLVMEQAMPIHEKTVRLGEDGSGRVRWCRTARIYSKTGNRLRTSGSSRTPITGTRRPWAWIIRPARASILPDGE
jgi:hypothetical protein